MKKKKIILAIVLTLLLSGYSVYKINLITKLNSYQKNDPFAAVEVYVLDEITEDEDKFEYKNHKFTMPSFININMDECSEKGETVFVCEKDSEHYFALLGGGDENSIKDAVTLYGMLLATLNIDLNDYSFFTPINKLYRTEKLALVRSIVSSTGPRFITHGTQNTVVYKTEDYYIIDVFGASSIIIRNDKELLDEEILNFIKTMEPINIFEDENPIIFPEKPYTVNESWQMMNDVHDTQNWIDMITMYEGIE